MAVWEIRETSKMPVPLYKLAQKRQAEAVSVRPYELLERHSRASIEAVRRAEESFVPGAVHMAELRGEVFDDPAERLVLAGPTVLAGAQPAL